MELCFAPTGYTVRLPDTASALAEAFGSSMMDAGELLHLAGTLAAYAWEKEAIIVEIGAYIGNTTVFMARVMQSLGKRAPILSIDAFERAQPDPLNPQGIYSAYLENVRAHAVQDVCLPLAAFSQDAARVVPDKIGVLVVDGDHHYPVVRKDLELYGAKVLPNGFIFIDDYGPAYPGVMRAVDEYFVTDEFTLLHKTYFVIGQRNAHVAGEAASTKKPTL